MAKGGTRVGGKPKGHKAKSTLAKEAARELTRQLVTKHLEPLIQAQVANAMGIKYLVVREKSGKFVRVTEAMAKARQGLTDTQEIIEVWEKDPSVQAFTDLLNRAIDKPSEQVQAVEHKGNIIIQWQE